MKNKKGFTLIELLAVIVILAIIMLIATPTILKVIESAKKGSYIESVNGILDAAEKYAVMNVNGKETIDLTNESKLSYKGKKPEVGTLLIDEKGHFSVVAKFEDYCIEKKFSDNSPVIVERESCELADSEIIKYDNYIALNKSNNDCVIDNTKICSKEEIIDGLEVSVNVNDNENYTFNVLKDNGESLDLQINFNLFNSQWISPSDYALISGNQCSDERGYGCNNYGPITLFKKIAEKTNNWININNQDGELIYINNTISLSNYKARIINESELISLNCEVNYQEMTCPNWFGVDNIGFWSSSIQNDSIDKNQPIRFAWNRKLNGAYSFGYSGVRPVITINKSVIKSN